MKGDFNGDGEVNTSDVILLQHFLVGKAVTVEKTDMLDDNKLNVFDLCVLKKIVLNQ